MTKIEKMNARECQDVITIGCYINELIDKVNQQEEQIKALQKSQIENLGSGKLIGFHELTEPDAELDVANDIDVTHEEDLSGKINEGLDRVFGCKCGRDDVCTCGAKTTVLEKEDLLVPDEVEFTPGKRGYGGMGIVFGNNQELYRDEQNEIRVVVDASDKRTKCHLVPCKLEDVEVGEWICCGYEKDMFDEMRQYRLYIGEKEFLHIGLDNTPTKSYMQTMSYDRYYKVQPIE